MSFSRVKAPTLAMFRCRLCKLKLGESRLMVVQHWQDHHPNEQPSDVYPGTKIMRCEACPWVGATQRNYGQHLQDMHPDIALQLFKHVAPLAKACECGKLFSGWVASTLCSAHRNTAILGHSGLQGHRKTCRDAAAPKGHTSVRQACRGGGKPCLTVANHA